jgi:predicted RNA-binding protein YlqC (UPF0109 family)
MAKLHTLPSADRVASQIGTATPTGDRLLDRDETNRLLGLKGRTAHTLRAMVQRGQLEAVRLNSRVLRYRESSVRALVEGRANA